MAEIGRIWNDHETDWIRDGYLIAACMLASRAYIDCPWQ